MFLELMRKDSFQGSDLVSIGNLLDDLGDLIVVVSGLDESESSLSSFVGGQDDISLLSGDGGIFIGLDDNGVSNEGSKAINMHSEFDFNEITFLDVDRFFLERGKIAAYFVDGDGGGEGKTLEDRFFIIDLGEFLIDLAVGPEAEFEDLATNCDLFKETTENICINKGLPLATLAAA